MRRALIVAAFLLCAANALAMQMVGFGATSDACGSLTELGFSGIGGTSGLTYQYSENLKPYTATCTGTLVAGYAYHEWGGTGDASKVCIYLDDGDNVPDSGDTKIGCTGNIVSDGAAGWKTNTFSGGTITKNSVYWVVHAGGLCSTGWDGKYDTESGGYDGGNDIYTNVPANLGGSWNTLSRKFSVYVTYQ